MGTDRIDCEKSRLLFFVVEALSVAVDQRSLRLCGGHICAQFGRHRARRVARQPTTTLLTSVPLWRQRSALGACHGIGRSAHSFCMRDFSATGALTRTVGARVWRMLLSTCAHIYAKKRGARLALGGQVVLQRVRLRWLVVLTSVCHTVLTMFKSIKDKRKYVCLKYSGALPNCPNVVLLCNLLVSQLVLWRLWLSRSRL